jgi:hypothetical protein
MMELQRTELDVRTREHYRHVDDANRNAWLRPRSRHIEPRMLLRSVLGAVRLQLAPSTVVDREPGLVGSLRSTVTSSAPSPA